MMTVVRHVTVHVVVIGRVQGVGFRAYVEDEALKLGASGWVRNRRDGSVEAVFAGEEQAVAAVIEACRKGPPGARVEAFHQREGVAEDLAPLRPGERFSMLPTA
jgi:acylphosphatase